MRPLQDVTRNEAASLVVRTVEHLIGGPLDDDHPGFDDVDSDGKHADAIRRDEAATILTRVLDMLVADHGGVLPN